MRVFQKGHPLLMSTPYSHNSSDIGVLPPSQQSQHLPLTLPNVRTILSDPLFAGFYPLLSFFSSALHGELWPDKNADLYSILLISAHG